MNRLTKKAQFVRNLITGKEIKYISNESDQMCVDKLGELEDIEEQLGVDLITLFKALNVRDGVWVKDKEYGLCNWSMGQLWFGYNSSKSESFINPQIYFLKDGGYSYFKLSDYGKTWALTREELEYE